MALDLYDLELKRRQQSAPLDLYEAELKRRQEPAPKPGEPGGAAAFITRPEKERGPLSELESAVKAGIVRLPETLLYAVRAIGNRLTPVKQTGPARKLQPSPTEPEYWRDLRETSESLRLQGRMRLDRPLGEELRDYRWWIRNIGETVPQMGGALALHAALGPGASFAFMAGLEGGSAYEQTMADTGDELLAAKEGFAVGLVNGLIETLPLEALVQRVGAVGIRAAKQKAISRAVKILTGIGTQATLEGVTEGVQEAWQVTVAELGHKPDATAQQNANRIIAATLIGGAAGGIFGASGEALRVESQSRIDAIQGELQTVADSLKAAEDAAISGDVAKIKVGVGEMGLAEDLAARRDLAGIRGILQIRDAAIKGDLGRIKELLEPALELLPQNFRTEWMRDLEEMALQSRLRAAEKAVGIEALQIQQARRAMPGTLGMGEPRPETGLKEPMSRPTPGFAPQKVAELTVPAKPPTPGFVEEAAGTPIRTTLIEQIVAETKATTEPMTGVDITDYGLSLAEKRAVVSRGLHLSQTRNRRLVVVYPRELRAEDLRQAVREKREAKPRELPAEPPTPRLTVVPAGIERLAAEVDKNVAKLKDMASGLNVEWNRPSARPDVIPEAFQSPNVDVEERLAAAHGIKELGFLRRTTERAAQIWHWATRPQRFLPRDEFHAMANEVFRLQKAIPEYASDKAIRLVAAVTDAVGPKQFALFERKVLMDNLVSSVETGHPLRFGFGTIEEAQAYQTKLNQAVGQVPAVQNALELRKKLLNIVSSDLMTYGILTPEQARDTDTYFRQQVLSQLEVSSAPRRRTIRPRKPGFAYRRTIGPEELPAEYDYNTSYLEAETEFLTEAFAQIRAEQLLEKLGEVYDLAGKLQARAADMAKETGKKVDWHTLIPKGYTIWQPRPGNVHYRAFTIPEKLAAALQEQEVSEVTLTKEDLRKVLAMGGRRREMAIPETIARQLDTMSRPKTNAFIETERELIRLWKISKLFWPKVAIPYQVRNLSGDADPTIVAPRIWKHLPSATKELWAYHTGKKLAVSEQLGDAIALGVTSSGFTEQEMPKMKESVLLKHLTTPGPNAAVPVLPGDYLDYIRGKSVLRENLLRYAAYKYYLAEVAAGRTPPLGASSRKQMAGIPDVKWRAAKFSRDLIGDYGNITEMGMWLRTNLWPFYSWQEINLRRYPALLANQLIGPDMLHGKIGKAAGLTASTALRTILSLRLAALFAALYAFNRLRHPREEEKLGPWDRANPHIILGQDKDGKILVFRNVGALGDFLEWGGVNTAMALLPQYMKGQISLKDYLVESAKDPVNKVVQGLRPEVHLALGLLMGNSTFPDIFEPRKIERMDALLDAVGVRDEYNWAARSLFGSSRSVREGYLTRFLVGVVDPRSAALSQMYDLKESFLKKKGKATEGYAGAISTTKRMRDAAVNDDFEAFQRAKGEYLKTGRTYTNFRASINNLDPTTSGLSLREEREFETEFLTDLQRGTYRAAKQYAQDLRIKMQHWWNQVR